jgi:NTP pyrophosphatase (non-canonical NTP hydrolase)
MLKTQKLVHDMMVALELPLPNEDGPAGVQGLNFELLRKLVGEETDEFLDWMENLEGLVKEGRPVVDAWAQVIDAMCDLIVVIHNTSNAMGIDLEPFFDEVHRTNMAKAGGPKRADGKAMKPEGWTPPRIKAMLEGVLAPNCSGCRFLLPTGHVDEGICHNEASIHIGGFRSPSKGACCWKEPAKGTVCLCSSCGALLDVIEAVDEESGAVVPIPARVFCGNCCAGRSDMCMDISPGHVAVQASPDKDGTLRTPWCHLPKGHDGPHQCGDFRWE